MHRLKVLGLTLVAVLAVSAVAVASASAALPEFTVFPNKATGSGGAGTLETLKGEKVTCTAEKDKSEINGAKTVKGVVVTFTGCKESVFKANCNSAGAAAGEIVTNELSGEIGYVNKATKAVGLDLKPVGELFAEFNCTGGLLKLKVKGSVIGKLSPVNTATKEFKLEFKLAGVGKQEIEKFETGLKDTLETSK
ncbi:MAG: hypothetical protein JWO21_305, partial [Solirubrobacterales bacterium]|nr:hypothetical protein [Solirubrobacterales bacterium]